MNIAFLGLGQMGAGIALRLQTRFALTVWNRTAAATKPLTDAGARAAASAADAVRDADLVFTMLTDDDATRAVVFGSAAQPGILDALKPGAIHVTLGTISVALARQLTAAHQEKHQEHFGSPVFGRPQVAEDGKLWLATAGKASIADQLRPILETFSRGSSLVGAEPWQAHALKLGGNFMITATIQTLAEAFVYAESQGIEPAVFLETVNAALYQSAFIANYGKTMLNPPEKAGATVSLGIKDTRLFREAADAGSIRHPLADYLAGKLADAEAAGLKDADWAVGQYRIAQQDAAQQHAKVEK